MEKNTDISLGRFQNADPVLSSQFSDLSGTQSSDIHMDHGIRKRLALISAMAQLTSSGVTVYDNRKNIHVYTSSKFYQLFGYEIDENQGQVSNEVFDKKVHPDDLIDLAENGQRALKFLMGVPPEHRPHYKMVNEYRIHAKNETYIYVTEQHKILEQDAMGNVLLSLGVIDIAPNQLRTAGVKFQMHNFHTGELIHLQKECRTETVRLTVREREILRMVSDGKLSKEISDLLAISVHTVNTHRQRILEKLEVDNSIEAISTARRQGIIL